MFFNEKSTYPNDETKDPIYCAASPAYTWCNRYESVYGG
jgi:hypothetical protein